MPCQPRCLFQAPNRVRAGPHGKAPAIQAGASSARVAVCYRGDGLGEDTGPPLAAGALEVPPLIPPPPPPLPKLDELPLLKLLLETLPLEKPPPARDPPKPPPARAPPSAPNPAVPRLANPLAHTPLPGRPTGKFTVVVRPDCITCRGVVNPCFALKFMASERLAGMPAFAFS